MKTYYFTGRWQVGWKDADGYCYADGRAEWIVNFLKLEENGLQVDNHNFKRSISYRVRDVFFNVFEQEFGLCAPDYVYAAENDVSINWLKGKLALRNVFVNVFFEEQK